MDAYILVAGSRTFTDYECLCKHIDYIINANYSASDIHIISGGAKGADTLAKQYAMERGCKYEEFPADWDKYGKKAGYIRNAQMQDYILCSNSRHCILFWDGKSRGTEQNISLAQSRNTPLFIHYFENN